MGLLVSKISSFSYGKYFDKDEFTKAQARYLKLGDGLFRFSGFRKKF